MAEDCMRNMLRRIKYIKKYIFNYFFIEMLFEREKIFYFSKMEDKNIYKNILFYNIFRRTRGLSLKVS